MAGLHYASETGERSDELSIAEVQALIAAGTITEETLVWAAGMGAWEPLGECRQNFAGLDADGAGAPYSTLHYETADGPSDELSTAQAMVLLDDGSLTLETMVWTAGMEQWLPLRECSTEFPDCVTRAEARARTLAVEAEQLRVELPPELHPVSGGRAGERWGGDELLPRYEPEPEPEPMWLVEEERPGDISPSLASPGSPRAELTPAKELGPARPQLQPPPTHDRHLSAEVARLATALRQEARRREVAEARLAAAETARRALVSEALTKEKVNAAAVKKSQEQQSLLRAQLTASATERRRLAAREDSTRKQNEALHVQVESLLLRVAAVSAERDRLAQQQSGSQALVDQARAAEAAAVKGVAHKQAAAQSGLVAQRKEVDQMSAELDAARRYVELMPQLYHTCLAFATPLSVVYNSS